MRRHLVHVTLAIAIVPLTAAMSAREQGGSSPRSLGVEQYMDYETVRGNSRSVVEDDSQQRAFDFEPAVVLDEAKLAELVHEEVHA
jgi:hypothetical protein